MSSKNNFTPFKKFFVFLLSLIPGCGQMYLGLMKRGMFLLFSFFACCYLSTSVFYRVFSLGFIIIWIFGVFDAYNCRKKIGEGKEVIDDIDDIRRCLLKHRKINILVFLIVAVIEISRGKIHFFEIIGSQDNEAFLSFIIDNVMIFSLICIGLYCLFFRKK